MSTLRLKTHAPVKATEHVSRRERRRSVPKRRLWATVRSAILSVAAIIGVLCALLFGASIAFGFKTLAVISGSMEPELPVGSLVFAREVSADVPQAGDIVTVTRPNGRGLITHRLVTTTAISGSTFEYVLQGDANKTADPTTYTVTRAGLYTFNIPVLGYVSEAMKTLTGMLLAAALALILLVVFLLDPDSVDRPRRTRRSTIREEASE